MVGDLLKDVLPFSTSQRSYYGGQALWKIDICAANADIACLVNRSSVRMIHRVV